MKYFIDILVIVLIIIGISVIFNKISNADANYTQRCSQFADAKLADTPASCIEYFNNL